MPLPVQRIRTVTSLRPLIIAIFSQKIDTVVPGCGEISQRGCLPWRAAAEREPGAGGTTWLTYAGPFESVANTKGKKTMIVKRGSVVSHTVALEWGIGKVTEVNDIRATIQFNDGMIRKITSSHFTNLQPADPASYLPPTEKVAVPKVRAVRASSAKAKKPKKLEEATV